MIAQQRDEFRCWRFARLNNRTLRQVSPFRLSCLHNDELLRADVSLKNEVEFNSLWTFLSGISLKSQPIVEVSIANVIIVSSLC